MALHQVFDLEERLPHCHPERLRFVRPCDGTAIVVRQHHHGQAVEIWTEDALATDVEIVAVYQREFHEPYLMHRGFSDQVTTPMLCAPSSGLMARSGKAGLAAAKTHRPLSRSRSCFTVKLPPIAAMTTSPAQAVRLRSTTRIDPSRMPRSCIDVPETRTKYVAAGRRTSSA